MYLRPVPRFDYIFQPALRYKVKDAFWSILVHQNHEARCVFETSVPKTSGQLYKSKISPKGLMWPQVLFDPSQSTQIWNQRWTSVVFLRPVLRYKAAAIVFSISIPANHEACYIFVTPERCVFETQYQVYQISYVSKVNAEFQWDIWDRCWDLVMYFKPSMRYKVK